MNAGSGTNCTTGVTNRLEISPDQMTDAQYWIALYFIIVAQAVVGGLASGANILNIMVYSKMGLTDSITVSLMALAVSDLGVAVTTALCAVSFLLPKIPNVSFTHEIFMVPVAYPHVFMSRISALITAYISLERCLCVLLPLKVKRFITRTRTIIIMLSIYGAIWCQYPIAILKHPNGWKFIPTRNKTLLGVIPVTDPTILLLEKPSLLLMSPIIPISTFTSVLACTILLIVNLQRSRAWRQTTSGVRSKREGDPESAKKNTKETKAIKMVITIAVVFIVAIVPSCIQQFVVVLVPGFTVTGRYRQLFVITGMLYFVINTLNSGVNIVIYYKMSRKFRQAMNELF